MRIDFSAYELFLKLHDGKIKADELLQHPAYQTVQQHARHFDNGITSQDIEKALLKENSPFYGLRDIQTNMPRIDQLVSKIKVVQQRWASKAENIIHHILPDEDLSSVTIYPIIGYDMGIGMSENICMNLNIKLYLEHPEEFFYFIIHECTHVIYERHHVIPSIHALKHSKSWLSMFKKMLHNEGFAVFTPLNARIQQNHLTHSDYQVLFHKKKLMAHIQTFNKTLLWLNKDSKRSFKAYADHVFGSNRLTYRMGCEIIRQLKKKEGTFAVTQAFYMDSDHFVQKYVGLYI